MPKLNLKILILSLMVIFSASSAYAEETNYDRYGAVYEDGVTPESPSWLYRLFNELLVHPFNLVRWPIDKTLLTIEKHNLDKKALWAYETLQDKGISPNANVVSLSNLGGGVEVDAIRLAQLREHFPDAVLKGWFHYTSGVRRKMGGEVGFNRLGGSGLRATTLFDYENRPEEHFYGIGPNTSAGDGAVFSMETTTIKTKLGYSTSPIWSFDTYAAYKNINISNGRDGGRGQIGQIPTFSEPTIPGFSGDSIFSVGFEAVVDTRNQKENSTKGGRKRFAWSYNEGLNSSDARYFKYEVEANQYIRLGSDRRVLAINFYGEHNDEVGSNSYVPFHRMAKLGGYGVGNKRLSHTLRGYDFNRFFDESAVLFNIEYRYAIWEYREFKLDTVLFWDQGQVFGEFSKFQISDFKESYGLGFRLSLANITLLSLEMGHGDEGTNFFFKTSTPF